MWGRPDVPRRSPPRTNPQSVADKSWSINTSAPPPLQQDSSEVQTLHHFPESTVGLSSDHPNGKWLDWLQSFPHTPTWCFLSSPFRQITCPQILISLSPNREIHPRMHGLSTESFYLQKLVCSSNSILCLFVVVPPHKPNTPSPLDWNYLTKLQDQHMGFQEAVSQGKETEEGACGQSLSQAYLKY